MRGRGGDRQGPRAGSGCYSEGRLPSGGSPRASARDTVLPPLHRARLTAWPGSACCHPPSLVPSLRSLGTLECRAPKRSFSREELVVGASSIREGALPTESAPGLSGWRLSSGQAWCRLGQAGSQVEGPLAGRLLSFYPHVLRSLLLPAEGAAAVQALLLSRPAVTCVVCHWVPSTASKGDSLVLSEGWLSAVGSAVTQLPQTTGACLGCAVSQSCRDAWRSLSYRKQGG